MKPFLVQHLLEDACRNYPQKEAVKHADTSITFEALQAKAAALGVGLQKLSSGKGQRVAILLDKSIDQVVCLLGALYADLIFVLINPILHARQILHILNDCKISILIGSAKYAAKFQHILAQTTVNSVILEDERNDIFARHRGALPEYSNIGEDISNIIYTSGSTGLPKGIVVSHRNLIEGAQIVSQYLEITGDERILGLLPFNFDYGLNQLMTTLYKGCTLVLFQFFMPNSLLKILVDEKITGLAAIPTIWAAVFNPKMCKLDSRQRLPHLRYITNTGGKLPVATVRAIRNVFADTKLFLMYGLTEAFRSTYLDPAEVDSRPDSIGKAIPNVQVEIIAENGEICKPGEIGELIHRGACIAKGYWNNPELTEKVYRPNPLLPAAARFLERVVYSGDLAKKDKQGFLYYVGRKDAMLKKGGYRVSPTEVEELLMSHGNVAQAVVYGAEASAGETEMIALVEPAGPIDVQDLTTFCRQNAPDYLVPDKFIRVDSFELTETGKIDRQKAIREACEKYGR